MSYFIDPPEYKPTGAYTCDCCRDNIPGGETMYEILGLKLCEECIRFARETAPFRDEVER